MIKIDKYGYYSADATSSITADSTPVYSAISRLIDPFSRSSETMTDGSTGLPAWSCEDWMTWYNALKTKYGVDKANSTWGKAWLDGVSTSGGGTGSPQAGSGKVYDSSPIDCRTFNAGFKAFLSNNKYLNDVVFSGLLGSTIGAAESGAISITKNIGSGVEALGKGLGNSAKVISYVVPVLLVAAATGILWYGFKKVKTA